MFTRAKTTRLKNQLSTHRRAVNALTAASRQLHRTLEWIIDTADLARGPGPKKRTKGRKPKRSGATAVPATRRRKSPQDSERARVAALERRWGNLF